MNSNRAIQTRLSALGFSIVELMVAMTIGLVILLATTVIFVQSKQSHTTQDSLARLQENSRFAMQFLMRDLRMAGNFGCANLTEPRNTLNNSTVGGAFDVSSKIQGSESKSNWYGTVATPTPPLNMKAGTDAISLRYFDTSNAVAVTAPFAINTAGPIQVNPGSAFQQGDIVAVSDCNNSAIFQITGPTAAGSIAHVAGTPPAPGNFTANLGNKIYQNDAEIAAYTYAAYYIRDGTSGPALFRDTLAWNAGTNAMEVQAQELVEGIENLQIRYGEDMTNDNPPVPDRYVTAGSVANWKNVVAVRIGILARSLAQTDSATKSYGQELDANTYDVDGDGNPDYWDLDGDGAVDLTPPNDRFQRRVFRTTVLMRNLP